MCDVMMNVMYSMARMERKEKKKEEKFWGWEGPLYTHSQALARENFFSSEVSGTRQHVWAEAKMLLASILA